MISFKPEVRIEYWRWELMPILLNASMWSTKMKVGVHISSIDDSQHGATTLHGLSLAVDMNVDSYKPDDRESLYQYLRKTIPVGYDVICETDHVHIEYDPKRPEMRLQGQ